MKINELNVSNNGFIIITNDLMDKIKQFIDDEKDLFDEKNQEKIKELIWSILKYIFKRLDDDEDDKEICVKTLKYI